jgi:hypothetical protein
MNTHPYNTRSKDKLVPLQRSNALLPEEREEFGKYVEELRKQGKLPSISGMISGSPGIGNLKPMIPKKG